MLDAAARAALVDPALNVLADASAPPARRRDAARDLAAGTFDRVGAPLAGLLDVRNPEEVQRAALSSLDAHADPGVVAQLVRRWDGLTPSVKAEATRVAIMCSEAVPWRCHRNLVSDAVVARGADVLHILDGRVSAHVLTKFALVQNTEVRYPPPSELVQRELDLNR